MVLTGLDRLEAEGLARLRGKTIGLLCNQASVDRSLQHIADLLLPLNGKDLKIQAVFGPQHGPFGHTQDNMVEWEGYEDPRTGLRFISLYGDRRKPTKEMLCGIDLLIVDLQDVGARYYTFLWTAFLCMQACAELGIEILVLDRPNPIGGAQIDGYGIDKGYESFVGLHSIPMRHGLTFGEAMRLLQQEAIPNARLDVLEVQGWSAELEWHGAVETRAWIPPSPNMPSPATAMVYSGTCLLEGTNLSEGRGTTRPFEWVGAPFLNSWELSVRLNACGLSGAYFRPAPFQPSFQKHAGELCGGVFIHVLETGTFSPPLTAVAILQVVADLAPVEFQWKQPPYEYEEKLLPIDILAGGPWLRQAVENRWPLARVNELFHEGQSSFERRTRTILLYKRQAFV